MNNAASDPQVLAIIPARGGSKGVPRKNVRSLAGKPLIAHTLEDARQAQRVDRVVVSTDDEEIARVSTAYGAEVIPRPTDLSSDGASSESALRHVLDYLAQTESYRPDLVVFLQCTSPIREPIDIDGAIETLLAEQADSLVSVVESHPWLWRIVDGEVQSYNYDYRARPLRQNREPEFWENGSIYVFKPWVLHEHNNRLGGKVALYCMGERSLIDIDTEWDFQLAGWVLENQPLST